MYRFICTFLTKSACCGVIFLLLTIYTSRRFRNGDFYKSDTSSLYSHLASHDVNIFKFQILEIHENERFRYTKDIRQLETSLDAKERHWIWKLDTLTPQGLSVADTFHSQNRSSRKKRSRFFTFV